MCHHASFVNYIVESARFAVDAAGYLNRNAAHTIIAYDRSDITRCCQFVDKSREIVIDI